MFAPELRRMGVLLRCYYALNTLAPLLSGNLGDQMFSMLDSRSKGPKVLGWAILVLCTNV